MKQRKNSKRSKNVVPAVVKECKNPIQPTGVEPNAQKLIRERQADNFYVARVASSHARKHMSVDVDLRMPGKAIKRDSLEFVRSDQINLDGPANR